MATARLFLDTRRSGDGKPGLLKIYISQKCTTALMSLNIKLIPNKEWDAVKERVVNHPDRLTLNTLISNIFSRVNSILIELQKSGTLGNMSAKDIKEYCEQEIYPEKRKAKTDKTTFLYRFNQYADRMKPGSRRTFDHTLNRLTAFVGEDKLKTLTFEEMTVNWFTEFDNFMAQTAPSKNTRNIHYRNIRAVFNEAIEDEITSFYPFRRFKIKREVTAKRDLSVEELRRLLFFPCEEHSVKYRDYFALMFFLMGINNVDLLHLKEITKGRLEFHRAKTHHFFSMNVEPEALEIIKKYKGENYLLDALDRWNSDRGFRAILNKNLKKIGPMVRVGRGGKKVHTPLFPYLTTYYARHSWASIASSLDIPIETISAGLGHEYGNRITAIYINYDNSKVDAANRKVMDWVLYGIKDGEIKVQPGTPEFFGVSLKEAQTLGLIEDTTSVPKKSKKTV